MINKKAVMYLIAQEICETVARTELPWRSNTNLTRIARHGFAC